MSVRRRRKKNVTKNATTGRQPETFPWWSHIFLLPQAYISVYPFIYQIQGHMQLLMEVNDITLKNFCKNLAISRNHKILGYYQTTSRRLNILPIYVAPGRVVQSIVRLAQMPEIPNSIPGPAIYVRFFRLAVISDWGNGSCQLLAKVCALGTG